MNVVDSGGWLEYFTDAPNADFFVPAIKDVSVLLVPTLSLYEVFKNLLQQPGEGDALQAVATMIQGQVVALDMDLALSAAKLSTWLNLPMADSVMSATARAHGATLWTRDVDFEEIESAKYLPKQLRWCSQPHFA
jgi:predicted nucleic acid-binding protein